MSKNTKLLILAILFLYESKAQTLRIDFATSTPLSNYAKADSTLGQGGFAQSGYATNFQLIYNDSINFSFFVQAGFNTNPINANAITKYYPSDFEVVTATNYYYQNYSAGIQLQTNPKRLQAYGQLAIGLSFYESASFIIRNRQTLSTIRIEPQQFIKRYILYGLGIKVRLNSYCAASIGTSFQLLEDMDWGETKIRFNQVGLSFSL
jgi:hypothetical protein